MGTDLATLAPGQTLPEPLPNDLHGYRGRTLYTEEEEALALIPSPKAKAYLRALALTGQAGKAASIAGCSAAAAVKWRDNYPAYSTLESEIKADILARANDLAADKVYEGFHEWMYDGNGKLKGTRRRQDPGHTKAWLASIDPNWRPAEQGAQIITVQILQTHE